MNWERTSSSDPTWLQLVTRFLPQWLWYIQSINNKCKKKFLIRWINLKVGFACLSRGLIWTFTQCKYHPIQKNDMSIDVIWGDHKTSKWTAFKGSFVRGNGWMTLKRDGGIYTWRCIFDAYTRVSRFMSLWNLWKRFFVSFSPHLNEIAHARYWISCFAID